MITLSILACSISSNVTPIYTETPHQFPTNALGVGTPTKEPNNIVLSCVVNTDALNVRKCSNESCKNINRWLIQGDTINITKVSADGQWYFWDTGKGWINKDYCTTIK